MFRFAFLYVVVVSLTSVLFLGIGCKDRKSTTATSSVQSDSTPASTKPRNEIHTSGKVQTGTFVNGTAQDTSSTGTKPKQ